MMNKDKNQMAEKILDLTLEIIYLLTGEDYVIVKKHDEPMTCSSTRPYSLTYERKMDKKILQLTSKIIHLLTGEEWDYIEETDDYKDVMMGNNQPLSTLGVNEDQHGIKNEQKVFQRLHKTEKRHYKPMAKKKGDTSSCDEGNLTDGDASSPTRHTLNNKVEFGSRRETQSEELSIPTKDGSTALKNETVSSELENILDTEIQ
ncbi:gastrula zinc finger protein XlCGF66.1-like [Pelobates fuscus]|uniref:gastrula zinc finger protein XlCGF66.1-like n=1 Tax=Pelobates fuscus TaxID=191477 RepID=UPI002FE43B86